MPLQTIAILSPGDMGHAIGRLLRENGLKVITCLEGRSARTRGLSRSAGIIDIPSLEAMVTQADVILSITVSEVVPALCGEVASAIRKTRSSVLFAECNAIAPQTSRKMEPIITSAGGRYVDASIIGGPPKNGSSPRVYASGRHANDLAELKGFGLDVRYIGPEIGQASGIKMTYAAMTKGTAALHAQLLLAAHQMGLSEPLVAEFQRGHSAVLKRMEDWIPGVPSKARRWVSEMQEIQATFEHLGMTPHIFRGVTDMYRFIGDTPLGDETPESMDLDRTLEDTIRELSSYLEPAKG